MGAVLSGSLLIDNRHFVENYCCVARSKKREESRVKVDPQYSYVYPRSQSTVRLLEYFAYGIHTLAKN